jgi:hypothetical protein
MSNYQFTGVLKVKNDTIQVSEKFSKREFVVTDTSSQYPQDVMFQLTQDKCSLLDNVNVNDQITVSFNLRGREWINPQGEAKYFNSLDAWRVEKVGGNMGGGIPDGGPSAMNLSSAPVPPSMPSNDPADDDDLPF